MILQKMGNNSIVKKIFIFVSVFSLPFIAISQGEDYGYRLQKITAFYDYTNNYAKNVYIKRIPDESVIFHLFDSDKAPVQYDIKFFDNQNVVNYKPKTGNIDDYLNFLTAKAKDDSITFEWGQSIKQKETESIFEITVTFHKKKKSYKCIATFAFKGKEDNMKISSIGFDNFKEITFFDDNPKRQIPTSPIPFGCNLSAGWKIANGFNIGFGIDGLSKKWFGNRMRYGLEFNRLWGDYDAHYPSPEDVPATMTYKTQNKDWAIGPKIGYAFIGKYSNYDIDDDFRFSLYLGVGVVRYNFWFERTGNTSSEPHSSTAPYFKPSGRFEWGRLGFEVGWYLSAKDSPINGPTIQFIINIP